MSKVKKEERFLLKLMGLPARETKNETIEEAQIRRTVSNMAFYRIQLEELKQSVAENGWQDEYQNGENQKGKKQNPTMRTLIEVQKIYNSLQRHLQTLSKDSGVETDDLTDFLKST